jgi:hypothetical protein
VPRWRASGSENKMCHAAYKLRGRSYKLGNKPLKLQYQKLAFEARTGLRMMPTCTAGFPRYGWKAGLSGGAFPVRSSA